MEKNSRILYIVVFISLLSLALSFISLSKTSVKIVPKEENTFSGILKNDQITICYMVWSPSVIKDPNTGELSGFIIDLFKEIIKDADLKVNYVESTWGGFPADLNTGKCDAAVAGIYPTIGRSTSVTFTQPFFYAGNSGAVKSDDNKFRTFEDVNKKGVKVAVIQGEYGHIYSQKYLTNATLIVLEKSSDLTGPLIAVSSGQADVGLSTGDTVSEYVSKHSEVKNLFPDQPYSTTPISWAVRSDDQELLNFLNNAISYLKSTGFLDATAKKYNPSGWYGLKQEYTQLS